MRTLLFLLAITAWCSCGQPAANREGRAKQLDNLTELQTFPVQGGWGYAVKVNGKSFIRQETVPVVQGSHAFKTKEEANKVGNWVAARIRHNETFTLTLPVLQSLMGNE